VNYVSYWDACRFTNWLNNGQPTGAQGVGTTETGAYTLGGYNGNDGSTIRRNAEAKWVIPSEDEWYKAAYYKGGGTNAGYWDYPTCSNTTPSNVLGSPTDPGNNATFAVGTGSGFTIGSPYYRTEVGAHENSESAYGTFDQGGNANEWNEAVVSGSSRGMRGGSFFDVVQNLQAVSRPYNSPDGESSTFGFRVAMVPEPGSIVLLGIGAISLFANAWRRRKV
jgi:formylglycine-generating enzyme required for sulfatase activity